MVNNSSEFLPVAIEAAMHAGHLLNKGFSTSYEISSKKGHHNLVTTYDKLSESAILQIITKRFPTHGFLGEESGHSKVGDILWIVDPLDGTVNFAHNVPVFCVSIAVAVESKIVAGAIYQPISGELFWAERGKGAFLNGQQLQVSTQSAIQDAYLATGFPYNSHEDPLHCIETFARLTRYGIPIRRLGSAALDLAYVAAGRFDGYWEVTLQPWDLAAGLLLVEEAGGVVSRYDGSICDPYEAGTVIATNKLLHPQLQKAIHEIP